MAISTPAFAFDEKAGLFEATRYRRAAFCHTERFLEFPHAISSKDRCFPKNAEAKMPRRTSASAKPIPDISNIGNDAEMPSMVRMMSVAFTMLPDFADAMPLIAAFAV